MGGWLRTTWDYRGTATAVKVTSGGLTDGDGPRARVIGSESGRTQVEIYGTAGKQSGR